MMEYINTRTLRQKLKSYKRSPLSLVLFALVIVSAIVTVGILLFLIGYIVIKGIPNIRPELFEWNYTTLNVSLLPALINTVIMTFISILIAGPIGVFSAIYLVEYAKRGNKFVNIIRITAETLSGIPSIVYGLLVCCSL